ncbi:MFS transporter [Roseitranquillus sediminis]|uniref:MFS transporter n=1 Tax=Roseitranquillus sediminis TaxID=2809051 RepID=UPI001D0CAAE6|nr:MFS transporter [Roseitranquillus sediminis]MBM9596216.1 MFS transporter [Roseitranquillus sediminis]
MTPFVKFSAAGFAATAITYGPARMEFGLFLPEFRSAFSMSSGQAGLVSALGFLGLLAAYAMIARRGPRLPVVIGLCAATLGTALVALAPSLALLSAGVFLAMSSAGFAWAPFNNAVHRVVADERRPSALSIVSTGTSLGIAAAGAIALVLGLGGMSWRVGWAAFAVASALALLANWMALRDVAGSGGPASDEPWRVLLRARAIPLYGIALSFGVTTAVYISFAADRVQQAGGLPGLPEGLSPAVMFLSFGTLGLAGLATGRAKAAAGLPSLIRLLLIASTLSLLLVALAPRSWPGFVLSAGLQGVYVMMTSAVLAFWSERLFPELPSLSFTITLLAVAAGSVLGPLGAGIVSGAAGGGPMFLGAAALSAVTAAAVRPRYVSERPPDARASAGT